VAGEAAEALRRPPTFQVQVRLTRGLRLLSIASEGTLVPFLSFGLETKAVPPTPEKTRLHYRLMGTGAREAEPLAGREEPPPGNDPAVLSSGRRTAVLWNYRRDFPHERFTTAAAERGRSIRREMKARTQSVLAGPEFRSDEHRSDKPGI